LDVIRANLRHAVQSVGFDDVRVDVVFDPPWTSDRITQEGMRKLKEFGLAPPSHCGTTGPTLKAMHDVACPYCNSNDTTLESIFGPTLCRAIHYCNSCLQSFEQFKPVGDLEGALWNPRLPLISIHLHWLWIQLGRCSERGDVRCRAWFKNQSADAGRFLLQTMLVLRAATAVLHCGCFTRLSPFSSIISFLPPTLIGGRCPSRNELGVCRAPARAAKISPRSSFALRTKTPSASSINAVDRVPLVQSPSSGRRTWFAGFFRGDWPIQPLAQHACLFRPQRVVQSYAGSARADRFTRKSLVVPTLHVLHFELGRFDSDDWSISRNT
jgi:phenylacetate-CoA oxygenase PaaJ subunit